MDWLASWWSASYCQDEAALVSREDKDLGIGVQGARANCSDVLLWECGKKLELGILKECRKCSIQLGDLLLITLKESLPYNQTCCKICLINIHTQSVTSPNTNLSYSITKLADCRSSNLEYKLHCTKCFYITETGQLLSKCMDGHPLNMWNHELWPTNTFPHHIPPAPFSGMLIRLCRT